MGIIAQCVKMKKFSHNSLKTLNQKVTFPFKNTSNGYVTVAQGYDKPTCALITNMVAKENVISDKRKVDKLSRIQAKRQILSGKIKQTPNTTRVYCIFIFGLNLQQIDKERANYKDEKEKKIWKTISRRRQSYLPSGTDFLHQSQT